MKKLVIVTPVLNDWLSLDELVKNLSVQDGLEDWNITLVCVDDGSTSIIPPAPASIGSLIGDILVIKLKANQGHQRAIALGLGYVEEKLSPDAVVVMDCDGEDRPEDLKALINTHDANPGSIIVARRQKRSEGYGFRVFYYLYKALFAILTGKPISFGNYSLIPYERLSNVIYAPGVWNNFAATMLKCKIPISFVDTRRGTRYFGKSSMNLISLMLHGFSAISVFTDVVIGRIIICLGLISAAVLAAVGAIVYMKFVLSAFVPGYATYVILFLLTLLIMLLFFGFLTILLLLSNREQSAIFPTAIMYDLIGKVISVDGNQRPA